MPPTPDPDFLIFRNTYGAEAFRRLVERYATLVYRTAQRILGDRNMWAEDVSQAVFALLGRKAVTLPADLLVGAWLHRQTVRHALNVVRSESRRSAREALAARAQTMNEPPDSIWEILRPKIDQLILSLRPSDRVAIIMRYIEDRSLAEIGQALGLSPDTTQKRLSRAVAKLRINAASKASLGSATAWLSALSADAQSTIPINTSHKITSTAVNSLPENVPSFGSTLLTLMTQTKLLLIGAGAGLAVTLAWPITTQATSLPIAAPEYLTNYHPPAKKPARSATAASPAPRTAAATAHISIDATLSQIKALMHEPDTEVTRLRMRALLEALPADSFTAFTDASEQEFPRWHLQRLFPLLIEVWALKDARTAIPRLLKITREIPNQSPSILVQKAFNTWHLHHPLLAQKWLIDQQDTPSLAKEIPSFLTTISLALAQHSEQTVIQWAAQIQSPELQTAALAGLWKKWQPIGKKTFHKELLATYAIVDSISDPTLRMLACVECAKAIAVDDPTLNSNLHVWLQHMKTLPPSRSAYTASIAVLNVGKGRQAATAKELPRLAPDLPLADIARDVMLGDNIDLQADTIAWALPLLATDQRDSVIWQAANSLIHKIRGHSGDDYPAIRAMELARHHSDASTREALIYGYYTHLWKQNSTFIMLAKEDGRDPLAVLKNWPAELQPILRRVEADLQP